MTQTPISQTYDADNTSNADARVDAPTEVSAVMTAEAPSYGEVLYEPDLSVAPISLAMNPVLVKGDSAQKADAAATQAGDTPLMTMLKLLIPVAGVIMAAYLAKDKESAKEAYYGRYYY